MRWDYFVNKFMLVADMLETAPRGVYLCIRPRRFEKTTNISMPDAFSNIKYEGSTWFDGPEISEHHEFYRYKNASPGIRLDLKDVDTEPEQSYLSFMNLTI